MTEDKPFKEVKDCFLDAKKAESKNKKHKGLLITKSNQILAEEYISKAKSNLQFCEICKKQGFDYKLPEEWFYTIYYCALAILSKFGVESRSQRCTAAFLNYVKNKGLIEFDDNFIERISVQSEKEKETDVDRREKARYGSLIKDKDVIDRYDEMTDTCKKAINQCEEIVFSNKQYSVPREVCQ